jgi:hypothetical protein
VGKIILEFDSYEEHAEAMTAMRAANYREAFDAVWERIFRGRRKHGYPNGIINNLLGINIEDEKETEGQKDCNRLMDELEMIYQDIKQQYGIGDE